MGKRKNTTKPIPQSTDKKSPSSPKTLRIGEISIPKIWGYVNTIENIDLRKSLGIKIIASMVIAMLLVQIRLSLSQMSNAEVDQLPSFKYYKKRILSGEPGKYLGAAIGVMNSVLYQPQPTEYDPYELLGSYVDSLTSFRRVIPKPNANNVVDYTRGQMSRIIGLMQSCPSSSLVSFNVTAADAVKIDIAEVLNRCEITNLKDVTITVDDISSYIRSLTLTDAGGFPKENLTFDEPSSNSILELEIFTDGQITRKGLIIDAKADSESELTLDDYRNNLTAAEFYRYEAAVSSNMTAFISEYTQKVKERMKKVESSKQDETPSAG